MICRTTRATMVPLGVSNTAFLLECLGGDCHPLHFLRALTQNSIESIVRQGTGGEIVWDVDSSYRDGTGQPVNKLRLTDNGCGMTADEMTKYVNNRVPAAHSHSTATTASAQRSLSCRRTRRASFTPPGKMVSEQVCNFRKTPRPASMA